MVGTLFFGRKKFFTLFLFQWSQIRLTHFGGDSSNYFGLLHHSISVRPHPKMVLTPTPSHTDRIRDVIDSLFLTGLHIIDSLDCRHVTFFWSHVVCLLIFTATCDTQSVVLQLNFEESTMLTIHSHCLCLHTLYLCLQTQQVVVSFVV